MLYGKLATELVPSAHCRVCKSHRTSSEESRRGEPEPVPVKAQSKSSALCLGALLGLWGCSHPLGVHTPGCSPTTQNDFQSNKPLALTWATQNDLRRKSTLMKRGSYAPKPKRHAPNVFFGHATVQNILFFRHSMSGRHPETSMGQSIIEPETAMRGTGECGSPDLFGPSRGKE